MSQEQQQQQQSQTSTNQVVQLQQQPRFSAATYPQAAARYVTASQNSRNNQRQAQNDSCKFIKEKLMIFLFCY